MASTPKKTKALQVEVGSPTSFSFPHSLSGSPSSVDDVYDGSYRNNVPPNTPPLGNNYISYTLTPHENLLEQHLAQNPITPLMCPSPSDGMQHTIPDVFPDTASPRTAKHQLEKKQFDRQTKHQTKNSNSNSSTHSSTHNSNATQSVRASAASATSPVGVTGTRHKSKSKSRNLRRARVDLEKETLAQHGYKRLRYIADTLQGQTFLASAQDKGEVVIKKTRKDLYDKGITISKEGKAFNIKEDIVKEARMMQHFMANNPPASLIAFYDFFEDEKYYYLVMENGGRDFFDFVVQCHELIVAGKLSMKEWRRQCKFMFAQMIECIQWLHDTMHYCHLDVSLENILITNEVYFDESKGKLKKCYLKFIDFGLAKHFDVQSNPYFLCKKFVGKTHYKSPKVYAKKEEFRANKADIWSLGVCLFMMIIGAPPYNKACMKDAGFRFIKNKKISKLLCSWNRIKYVTPNLYDLMERMLCVDEEERITIDEIMQHDWIKVYFKDRLPSASTDATGVNTLESPMPPPMSSFPMSPSMSGSFSQSPYAAAANGSSRKLNIMIPQHAVSMTAQTPTTPCAGRKASTSYPYPTVAVATTPRFTKSQQKTPTPIIESHTSGSDAASCYAKLDVYDERQRNQQSNARKKKRFFKLNLPFFQSKKIK